MRKFIVLVLVVVITSIVANALVYSLDYVYIVVSPIKYYFEYGSMNILGLLVAQETVLSLNFTFTGNTWAKLDWSVPAVFNGLSLNGSIDFFNGSAYGWFTIIGNNTYTNYSSITTIVVKKLKLEAINNTVRASLVAFVKYSDNQGFLAPIPMDMTDMVKESVEQMNLTWVSVEKVIIGPGGPDTMMIDASFTMDTRHGSNPLVMVIYCMLSNKLSGNIRFVGETGFTSTNKSIDIVVDGSLRGNITRFAECLDEKFIENYFFYNKVMPGYPFRVEANITTLFNGNHSITTTNITIENVETTSPEDVGKRIMIILEGLGNIMDPYQIRYLPKSNEDKVVKAYINILHASLEKTIPPTLGTRTNPESEITTSPPIATVAAAMSANTDTASNTTVTAHLLPGLVTTIEPKRDHESDTEATLQYAVILATALTVATIYAVKKLKFNSS